MNKILQAVDYILRKILHQFLNVVQIRRFNEIIHVVFSNKVK